MVIKCENLTFKYDDAEIIRNLNLSLSSKDFTIIKGVNGSGKTTLSKLIMSLLTPTSGRVLIDDKDNKDMKLYEVGSKIGYLFQNPQTQIFTLNVSEELSFTMKLEGISEDKIQEKVNELLFTFHLEGIRNSEVSNLSGGEIQRLAIATLFVNERKFYILDEPIKSLDEDNRKILLTSLEKIHKQGSGIVIISHYEEVENFATRVIRLGKGGEIIEDRYKS